MLHWPTSSSSKVSSRGWGLLGRSGEDHERREQDDAEVLQHVETPVIIVRLTFDLSGSDGWRVHCRRPQAAEMQCMSTAVRVRLSGLSGRAVHCSLKHGIGEEGVVVG